MGRLFAFDGSRTEGGFVRVRRALGRLASACALVAASACGHAPTLRPPAHGEAELPAPPRLAPPAAPPAGVQLRLTAEQRRILADLHRGATSAFSVGDYPRAEQLWLQAAHIDPSEVAVRLGLGRIWLMRAVVADDDKARAQAREAFAFVVQSCPSHAQAQRLLDLVDLSAPTRR